MFVPAASRYQGLLHWDGMCNFARSCELQLTGVVFGRAAGTAGRRQQGRDSDCDSGGAADLTTRLPLLSSSGSDSSGGGRSGRAAGAVGALGASVYGGAVARLRWLLLQGLFGVSGELWWRRGAGRLD